MRILVLGGTAFLSRAVAQHAVARGHEVTCAARGLSGEPPEGARFIRWDRADPMPPHLAAETFDGVVDVTSTPDHVRRAVDTFPGAHWVYVSSINAYADVSRPGGTPDTTPLHAPLFEDRAPETPEEYGGMKVACEQLVTAGAASRTLVRPGLIVGPGDPSGRFASWPRRIAQAAEDGRPFLVPLPASAPVQWIDVRDLADWIVTLLETRHGGVLDGVAPPRQRGEFVAELTALPERRPEARWVAEAELTALDIRPWAGPRSISLWLPWPGWEGFMTRAASPAAATGLRVRSLSETARDAAAAGGATTGLTRIEELAALRAL